MLILSLIIVSAGFGMAGFLRTGQRVRWIILLFLGFSIFYTILHASVYPYPTEAFLSRSEIWVTIILPVQAKMVLAYAFGEVARVLFTVTFGEHTKHNPTRVARFINNFGAKAFKLNQLDTGKDLDLRSAIDVSVWLYLDRCENRRRLASAIGREYDLPTEARIGLLQELTRKTAIEQDSKPPTKNLQKRNRENSEVIEKFYESIVRIGLRADLDLTSSKPRLKSLSEALDIDLSRADKIVRRAWDAIETLNKRTRNETSNAGPNGGDYRKRKQFTKQQQDFHDGPLVEHLAKLGLQPGAEIQDVKSAYRRLAKKAHPDYLQANDVSAEVLKQAGDKMLEINDAYAWLSKNL